MTLEKLYYQLRTVLSRSLHEDDHHVFQIALTKEEMRDLCEEYPASDVPQMLAMLRVFLEKYEPADDSERMVLERMQEAISLAGKLKVDRIYLDGQ